MKLTHRSLGVGLTLFVAAGLSACGYDADSPLGSAEAPVPEAALAKAQNISASSSWIVISQGTELPSGFASDMASAGGEVTQVVPQIGMVTVTSDDPGFAKRVARMKGVRSVVPDIQVQWIDPPATELGLESAFANPPTSGDDDFLFDLQWGHDAVDAVEAWNAGYRGAGVRVAVLDSGIDADHPDIAPNLNLALSASFVPGESVDIQPGFYFNHGTHVAGTIGAADNGTGVIGVAPEVELVAVKVLSEFTGGGAFSWLANGIVYAALIDADVINMSLGAILSKAGVTGASANEVAELRHLVDRAVSFAYQSGTTVIVAAGNDALNLDGLGPIISTPAESPHAISISATHPVGWAINPNTSFHIPATYTNYGRSLVDFSGPGGDIDDDLFNSGQACIVVVVRPCWVFDLVFSTISGGWGWAGGTSMAAPHASGVAAIIIGKNGGDMHPAQVKAAMQRAAEHPGGNGRNAFYGRGAVNAGNAVN